MDNFEHEKQNNVDRDQNVVDRDKNTVDRNQNTVNSDKNTVNFDQNTADRKEIRAGQSRADGIEFDDIIRRASEKAQEQFPNKGASLLGKFGLILVGILIALNSVVGLYNTAQVAKTNHCQRTAITALFAIGSSDRHVVDQVVNDALKSKNPAQIAAILNAYNAARAVNDAKRSTLLKQVCK